MSVNSPSVRVRLKIRTAFLRVSVMYAVSKTDLHLVKTTAI